MGGTGCHEVHEICGHVRYSLRAQPLHRLPIEGKLAVAQWLVPSEKVILFHTLYLPEGRDIGIRLTSAKVAAS